MPPPSPLVSGKLQYSSVVLVCDPRTCKRERATFDKIADRLVDGWISEKGDW
jgi:hypothetical protein